MINALLKRFRPAAKADESPDQTAIIDLLMAGPIKQPAKITVFGDDGVMGINPAPIAPSNEN